MYIVLLFVCLCLCVCFYILSVFTAIWRTNVFIIRIAKLAMQLQRSAILRLQNENGLATDKIIDLALNERL